MAKENSFDYETNKVILATGYKPHIPAWFYDRFQDKIMWEDEDHYKVTRDYQIVFTDQRDHRFSPLLIWSILMEQQLPTWDWPFRRTFKS